MSETEMTALYEAIGGVPRLLMEVDLKPLQGSRFQPTGFPDLGPARYTAPDGTEMLLVESPQSVANRMEVSCLDSAQQDIIPELAGLPYIKILDLEGNHLSNSLLEAHRINSEYIMNHAWRAIRRNGKRERSKRKFKDEFTEEIGLDKTARVDWRKFRAGLLHYDPNSLLHGCFLEEIDGRLRVSRAMSGFIEATGVAVAESGGAKINIVQPQIKGGEGNVLYHRTEFTAKRITAYFNLDLALLRSYQLPEEAEKLLIALGLFKIRRFLSRGLRLRTACDLEPVADLEVTRPEKGLEIPAEEVLVNECRRLIQSIRKADEGKPLEKKVFADPPVTEVICKR